MDVLNEQKLHDEVIDPLVTRLLKEVLPSAEAVISRQVLSLTGQISTILATSIAGALDGIQGIEKTATSDVSGLLASLDGWTATITIKLNRPEGAA